MVSYHLTRLTCYLRVITKESVLYNFQVVDIVDLTSRLTENILHANYRCGRHSTGISEGI